jgi:hypothetical protein
MAMSDKNVDNLGARSSAADFRIHTTTETWTPFEIQSPPGNTRLGVLP